MRYRLGVILALSGLIFSSHALAADKYEIDPAHTQVGFAVKHLMLSNVNGKFTGVAGEMSYDEQAIAKSSVQVTIQANTIDTNLPDRDKHLKSPDFFDVEKYPTITFESTKIAKTEEGYVCTGNLTMHGVTKEIMIPFTLAGKVKDPWGKTRIGVDAEFALNRKDFGIVWNKAMDGGGVVVGEKVKIVVSTEATLQP